MDGNPTINVAVHPTVRVGITTDQEDQLIAGIQKMADHPIGMTGKGQKNGHQTTPPEMTGTIVATIMPEAQTVEDSPLILGENSPQGEDPPQTKETNKIQVSTFPEHNAGTVVIQDICTGTVLGEGRTPPSKEELRGLP